MRIEHDPGADALYIVLRDDAVATTREVDDNLILDLGADGKMVGIELLFVSDYLDASDIESLTISRLAAS